MIISFFSTGTGGGAAPVDYLTAREVLTYDENRNLIRDDTGQPQTKIRDPLPEVLHGNPDQTRDLIDASANKWSYTAGVISFADSDDPSPDAQQETIELFEALAFAGLDRDQYDCLWVRHTHEGNVELHFCAPRLELSTGKALNIAPPGHETAFSSLRDLMNKTHGWADPLDPERAREVRATIEAPTRAGREALHDWILDQISIGIITDRASMTDVLSEAGFEIPRASKNYITAKDPDTGERWRLKGEISMTTGKPNRLAEKLNLDLETIRRDHAALMASQLESFRSEFSNIATSALHTIETDIRFFLSDSKSELERRSETIRRWLTISPWMIVGMVSTWIATVLMASWFWMGLMAHSEMTELGLTRIEQSGQTWVTLDPNQTELKTCTMAQTPIICIEIKEH
ncbi:relaxase/mobilization nuclease domain-containing protein [Tropicibacter sp. R15_0]|uniref:relaxase/mobilization nuclease domain-containing protein n=1 Tax=Tropicibacter sp. R15_0 TaxID=2821101 RepID=UPI002570BCE1|nr:relaxase/mobilization nuclease domain-containing protein [Tropicibacter sp. R15_0]